MASDFEQEGRLPNPWVPSNSGSFLRCSPRVSPPTCRSFDGSVGCVHPQIYVQCISWQDRRYQQGEEECPTARTASPRRSRTLVLQHEHTQPPWTSIPAYPSNSSVYTPGVRKCWSFSAAVGQSLRQSWALSTVYGPKLHAGHARTSQGTVSIFPVIVQIWLLFKSLALTHSANSRLETKIENESNTTTCDTRATSKRDNGSNIRGTRQAGMESTRN
jgi:hypothetical protein